MRRKIIDDGVLFVICTIVVIFAWCINKYFSTYNVKYKLSSPKERESKGEKITRKHLQETFGMPFKKVRPNFLKNPLTGKNLELDCYNEQLRLAVEYNGKYHYDKSHVHHSAGIEYRDALKRKLCAENNITLIVVPYNIPFSDIPSFIDAELERVYFSRVVNYAS